MIDRLFSEPTVRFCEKVGSGLIKRPWYALSNFAYLIIGLIILRQSGKTFLGALFGFLALLIGTLSLIYDVTYLRLTQLFDIAGMLVFVLLLLFLAINAIKKIPFKRYVLFAVPLLLLLIITTYSLGGQSGNIIFGTLIFVFLCLELYCYQIKIHTNYKHFIIAFVLVAIGFALWIPDNKGIFCFEFGLLNGRVIFHYLTAVAIYQLYLFYSSQEQIAALK